MEVSDIPELHYITHIDNVVSILKHGILSHKEAQNHKHISVADQDVQARRARKRVPDGLPLHHYANLYINARNPMLFIKCQEGFRNTICVIRVNKKILLLENVIIADGNAASDYTAFKTSPSGLAYVNKDLVFAESWKDQNQIEEWKKKRAICAEVLIPGRIAASLVEGIFVASPSVGNTLKANGVTLPISINRKMFFLGNG